MFSVGDKVVYPVHGAGIIEKIETREFLGKERDYYVLNIPTSSMKVMVPCDNVEDAGIRNVISSAESKKVLSILGGYNMDRQEAVQVALDDKWNRRYRVHMDKIKSGNIYDLAETVRALSLRNDRKPLSGGEKKLLDQAKDILVSELVLACNATAESMLEEVEEKLRQKA